MDYSDYSCDELYRHALDQPSQCAFASTCNDGDGIIFASIIYCSEKYSSQALMWLFSAPLVLFLIVLFRILGSTAEEFFSPGLEMFSIQFGLPERFAAVTLLALGNGAPDVASTVSAIRNDRKRGYLLALGELTGASMVASTVIVGAVAFVSPQPVPCRGAFVRDVVMFIITMILVFCAFNDGTIDPAEVKCFIGIYLGYVLVVLAADIYHRKHKEERHHTEEQHETITATTTATSSISDNKQLQAPSETTALTATPTAKPRRLTSGASNDSTRSRTSVIHRLMEAFTNYDESSSVIDEDGDDEEEIEPQQLQQQQPQSPSDAFDKHRSKHHHRHSQSGHGSSSTGWGERHENGTEPLMVFHPHHGGMVDLKRIDHTGGPFDGQDQDHWLEVRQELRDYFQKFFHAIYYSGDYNTLDKFLMTCELPFTLLRMFTIPVPCDGYYCRPALALSVILSPFWLCFYFHNQFDVNIQEQPWTTILAVFAIPLAVGLLVLRFAPRGDVLPKPWAGIPLTLVGFVVSATWLDLIADKLVNLMTFFGIVCRLPSSIMGLTVLAWGNASQDLIANMTVARKELSTMAITASFAGPVFNILVGLGLGFAVLDSSRPGKTVKVHLDNPLRIGFLFCILNGVLMIATGVCYGKGAIPQKYGYVALLVYFIYVVVSLTV